MRHIQSIPSVTFAITLSLAFFACSSSSDDSEEISSSSALSSSSAEISSSSSETKSSSSIAESSSSEVSDLCAEFDPEAEVEHYGKNKKQICDACDGKTYRTIEIGTQVWMAENLNFATENGSWCYEEKEANCTTYGKLYDWETALTVCPTGWHLPDSTEWRTLINSVGTAAGTKLKSTSGWIDCNDKNYCDDESGNGTDNYGFSALPSGAYCDRFECDGFGGVGEGSGWWTTTEYNDNAIEAYNRIIWYDSRGMGKNRKDKSYGFSVRCLRG